LIFHKSRTAAAAAWRPVSGAHYATLLGRATSLRMFDFGCQSAARYRFGAKSWLGKATAESGALITTKG
jgi:hypothetical protein